LEGIYYDGLTKLSMSKKAKKVKKIRKKKMLVAKTPAPVTVSQEIPLKRTKIRVFGIGGGGSSIVSEIASRVKKASFCAVNTDHKALGEVKKNVIRFQFGENFTHGLGTGMNDQIGEEAAIAEKERIQKLFEGQDLCVFVACLGGGTGSGATKVFTKLAKASGCLTYGIFTLPFNFEGEKKAAIAKKALEDLKQKLHAFSVIPNERIFQIIQKETPLRQALSCINTRLADSLEGLIEIIYEPGLINIDFADLKAILQGAGRLTYLNTVQVRKKDGAVQEEIDKLLNSQLYSYGIKGARNVLYNIAGEKDMTLAEVSQISKNISDLVSKEAKIIFGISQNQKYSGIIKTTLLATGCGTKIFSHEKSKVPEKPKAPKKKTEKKQQAVAKKPEGGKKEEPKKAKRVLTKPKRKKIQKKSKKIQVKVTAEPAKNVDKAPTPVLTGTKTEAKIRKNALQIKEEADLQESQMQARERLWETPAFLRRKKI
jgi:cell division protein FtsZ